MSEKTKILDNWMLKNIMVDALLERPIKASFDEMSTPGTYSIASEVVKSGYPEGIFPYGVLIVAKGGDFTAQIYIPHNWMREEHVLAFRVLHNGVFNKWVVLPQSSVIIQS